MEQGRLLGILKASLSDVGVHGFVVTPFRIVVWFSLIFFLLLFKICLTVSENLSIIFWYSFLRNKIRTYTCDS